MEHNGGEPGGYRTSCVPCGSQAAQSVLSIGSNDVFPPPRDAAGLLISQLIALPPVNNIYCCLMEPRLPQKTAIKAIDLIYTLKRGNPWNLVSPNIIRCFLLANRLISFALMPVAVCVSRMRLPDPAGLPGPWYAIN